MKVSYYLKCDIMIERAFPVRSGDSRWHLLSWKAVYWTTLM